MYSFPLLDVLHVTRDDFVDEPEIVLPFSELLVFVQIGRLAILDFMKALKNAGLLSLSFCQLSNIQTHDFSLFSQDIIKGLHIRPQ